MLSVKPPKASRKTPSGTPREILSELRSSLERPGTDWRRAILQAVGRWPVVAGKPKRCEYLIGGEAFDWKHLASELCLFLSDTLRGEQVVEWLFKLDPFGGVGETEFARLVGTEKYRAHLNYYYGVVVERALQLAAEGEERKNLAANCIPAGEDLQADAFKRLYGTCEVELRAIFLNTAELPTQSVNVRIFIDECDSFTYWLFKRRISLSVPARLASDTKKGLLYLEKMRIAHTKRNEFLKPLDG